MRKAQDKAEYTEYEPEVANDSESFFAEVFSFSCKPCSALCRQFVLGNREGVMFSW